MKRIVIAALAGGLVFFIWSAAMHMLPFVGMLGIKSLPDAALEGLKTTVPDSGLYFFPGVEKYPTPEQQKAWEQKLTTGPYGILVYTAGASAAMSPKQLVSELLTNIFAAFIAACIVAMISATYMKRVFVVMLLGVFAWISLTLSFWIWYNFPTLWVLAQAIIEIIGWFIAGLVIAKIVPARAFVR